MRKTTKKVLSLILTLAMVFSVVPLAVFAEGEDSLSLGTSIDTDLGASATPTSIIAFDPEPYHNPDDYDTTYIVVDKNTAEEDIPLPMTLPATIEGGEANAYSVAVEKWESADYDAATPGLYSFSPVPALLENESIAEGAMLPVVEVVVTANEGFMATATENYTLVFKQESGIWGLYKGNTTTPYTEQSGKWVVSGDTLELDGFEFKTTDTTAMQINGDAKIKITNTNTIESIYSGPNPSIAVFVNGDLEINGTGTLNVKSGNVTGAGHDSIGMYVISTTEFYINGNVNLNVIAGAAQNDSIGIELQTKYLYLFGDASVTTKGGTSTSGASYGIKLPGDYEANGELLPNGYPFTASGETSAIYSTNTTKPEYVVISGHEYTVSANPNGIPATIGIGNGSFEITSAHKYVKLVLPSAPTITTTSLVGGQVGTAYSQILTSTGSTPITWTIDSGSLPAGLSLNAGTGVISGTPTTAGTSNFTVKAANGTSPDDTQALSIVIAAAPVAPTITTATLPNGQEGTAYSQTLAAAGDTPITWSIDSGSLPAGLSLNAGTGVISGTPTTAGTSDFTVKAANGTSPDDTQALSITIAAAPIVGTAPTITTTSLAGGQEGSAYSQTLAATGTAPITWSVNVGSLPAGLSLNGSTGVISGTPTTAGTSNFTIMAANGTSPDDTQALSIVIAAVTPPTTYTINLNANGGSISPASAVTGTDGRLTSLPTPTRSNYTFKGWFTASISGTQVTTSTVFTSNNTIFAQWTYSGSSGSTDSGSGSGSTGIGGGSSGDSGSYAPGSIIPVVPAIYWIEKADTPALIKTAKDSSLPYTLSRRIGATGIRVAALSALSGYEYRHDTMDGKAVGVRVYVPKPELVKTDLMVSGYVKGSAVDKVRALFEKYFNNKIRVIHLDQKEDWGQPVQIAAKVDLSGMDTNKLYFYSYNAKTNTYRRIVKPAYWIDANGYLRFTTEYAGDIIISEGSLVKK